MNLSDLSIDIKAVLDFLTGLLNTPSPTGYTQEGIAYVQAAFEKLSIPNLALTYTPKGALLATCQGQADTPQRLLQHILIPWG